MNSPTHGAAARINLNPLAVLVIVALTLLLAWNWLRPAAAPETRVVPERTDAPPAPSVANAAIRVAPVYEPPASPERQLALQQSVFSTFETRFREDTPDAGWSAPTERKLIEAASEPALVEFGVPLSYHASCSGHLCKIDMSFAHRAEADDWSEVYVNEMGGIATSVRTATIPNADGTTGLVMYAARAGSESLLFDPPGTRTAPPGPPPR